jgi:vitamin B12/bleomycin/antimicrobial peptide transport system ATP-binding/permease protein
LADPDHSRVDRRPSFINGNIAFGVITQSAVAFTHLVAAFSLIVTQFQSLSNFAAVVARLGSLMQAMEHSQETTGPAIAIVEAEGRLAYEHLTLLSTNDSPLLKDLSIAIPFETRALMTGPNQAAAVALFRATAGLASTGTGRIIRPGPNDMLFLAQRPYLPPGTLRQVLEPDTRAGEISDDRILELLRELNCEQALSQAGGLESERDWGTLLALHEQQLLAFGHVLLAAPRIVFLDRVGAVLGADQIHTMLRLLSRHAISYINIGEDRDSHDFYDAVLECKEGGGWTWTANGANTSKFDPIGRS